MRSKKQLASALALSAVLALGTSSLAFAATTDDAAAGDSALTAKTTVTIVTEDADDPTADQLSVTVPVDVRVVAKAEGGQLTCPDASHYCISNNTNKKIKVTGLCDLTGNGLDLMLASESAEVAEAGKDAPAGRDGALCLSLTPVKAEGEGSWVDDSVAGVAWNVSSEHNGWTVDGGGCLNIEMAGSTSKLAKLLEVTGTAPASLAITYQVALADDADGE